MMASLFIVLTISADTILGAETPTNTSAPTRASAKEPVFPSRLVTSIMDSCIQLRPSLPLERMPDLSHIVTFLKPYVRRSLVIATPAEPAPLITTLHSSLVFPVTLSPLMIPARTTMAVPCWSSWNTGISRSSFNLDSISKHLGADISSRLIPPNAGAILTTVLMISSVSCVSRHIGTALTPPNDLNNTALPSITGIAACAPILPSPKTALPSDTTAIVLDLIVYL